ncbi:MAG: hypothetical protein GX790_08615 [Syntrophomonadaceae bacterium]|nr:hypothetical protein [Syntrophomonadaceae bacterium]
MAELINCPRCGRLFAAQGANVCRRCQDLEDQDYMIVRRYVRDNPGATVFEVAEATGIEEDKILKFLRDGRLQSRGMTTVNYCERCNNIINEGKYCNSCLRELNSQISEILPSKKKPNEDYTLNAKGVRERMYIKDNK